MEKNRFNDLTMRKEILSYGPVGNLRDIVDRCANMYGNNILFSEKKDGIIMSYGALKLKEITYIHGEGYPAGELKHGPLALIEDNIPVVGILPPGPSYRKTYNNLQEIKARGADMIILGANNDTHLDDIEDKLLFDPEIDEVLSPLLYIIDLQLLAYYISIEKGIDPDKPKNLAKSVTVE